MTVLPTLIVLDEEQFAAVMAVLDAIGIPHYPTPERPDALAIYQQSREQQ